VHRREGLRPDDSVFGEVQAEFLVQFAQGTLRRALGTFAATAGQVDQAGPGDAGLVVTAVGENAAIKQTGQLGAGEIRAIPGADQGCTAWA